MMEKPFFQRLAELVSRFKYLIVLAIFLFVTGVASDSSLVRRASVRREVRELKQQIRNLEAEKTRQDQILLELNNDSIVIERIAREKYGMHRSDEDVFIEHSK